MRKKLVFIALIAIGVMFSFGLSAATANTATDKGVAHLVVTQVDNGGSHSLVFNSSIWGLRHSDKTLISALTFYANYDTKTSILTVQTGNLPEQKEGVGGFAACYKQIFTPDNNAVAQPLG